MKMVGDLMNMGNEERVSKVSSRFNRNAKRVRCEGCRFCGSDKIIKEMVNYFHNLL